MAQNGRKEGEQLFCHVHHIFDWCREDKLHPVITASNAKDEALRELLVAAEGLLNGQMGGFIVRNTSLPYVTRLVKALAAYREAQRTCTRETPAKKIRCVKVTRQDSHGGLWCLYRLDGFDLSAEFDGADCGEQITIELCEMTAEELRAVPEFPGW